MTVAGTARNKKENRIRIHRGPLEKREARAGLMFVLPWIIGAAVFLIYPLGMSLWYSLNNIVLTTNKFTFVGQGNFTQILVSDPDFLPDLVDYLINTLVSVPVIVVFALLIALMLNEKIRGKSFFRLIFFLPVIIVSGPILSSLTEQNASTISIVDAQAVTGAIAAFLPEIIAKPVSELFSNMVTILWYSGVPILIFLSALQKIDRSQYEAAYVDGASGWERFWKITMPSVKPMILLNCVYTVVFVSSNDQNQLINKIKSDMLSGVPGKGYGYASAMAWVYSIVVLLIVGLFTLLFMTRKDKYERQAKRMDRQAKRERREVIRIQRRQARHAQRYHRPTVR